MHSSAAAHSRQQQAHARHSHAATQIVRDESRGNNQHAALVQCIRGDCGSWGSWGLASARHPGARLASPLDRANRPKRRRWRTPVHLCRCSSSRRLHAHSLRNVGTLQRNKSKRAGGIGIEHSLEDCMHQYFVVVRSLCNCQPATTANAKHHVCGICSTNAIKLNSFRTRICG